jgi:hypothetical protein
VGDSRDAMPGVDEAPCDVVITSPPYGDNITTVPYGQYSFLPLQWIDFNDIHPAAKKECLNTTHEIDHRSLGGIRRIDAGVVADLHQRSPHNLAIMLNASLPSCVTLMDVCLTSWTCCEVMASWCGCWEIAVWVVVPSHSTAYWQNC